MIIPIQTDVDCAEGPYGHSTRLVVERTSRKVTHIVVREPHVRSVEILVPIEELASADPTKIVLRSTRDQINAMTPFITNVYAAGSGAAPGSTESVWDFTPTNPEHIGGGNRVNFNDFDRTVEHENLEEDELAASHARVEATNGSVGWLREVVVDPESKVVTDLVMRGGHMWNHRDVMISMEDVDFVLDGKIHLKLDKQGVSALPAATE